MKLFEIWKKIFSLPKSGPTFDLKIRKKINKKLNADGCFSLTNNNYNTIYQLKIEFLSCPKLWWKKNLKQKNWNEMKERTHYINSHLIEADDYDGVKKERL